MSSMFSPATCKLLFEVVIEAVQKVGPLLLAVFDVVQFLFQLGGVLRVEDVRKVVHQQLRHTTMPISVGYEPALNSCFTYSRS